ncbi:IclR family transcriptional regulator [Caulobacter segnis]|uniref:Transcriptional regulator, IclR family n=2 Tax=Caulobacter segnis TaxID=88688 RepID=D5VGA4_CAUST|nr:IclR family transcriptional regulator [Caulobacter segnis]ADG10223.1 transcriptional regulator, IclR family [Caulobacter segnis ATCC 21756]AVQ01966.1 IclR family transcriptional regulator [Caulobacter segnis]
MTTADRVLSVLQLFTMAEPEWTVEDAARRLEVPTSTAYRYFRSLVDAGLIVNFTAGRYVIGPAIIELDRQTRHLDPLILAAQPTLSALVEPLETTGVSLLCRIYRRTVICVDQGRPPGRPLEISYERGRPMPLFRGAASKSITAHITARTLKRYFEDDIEAAAAAGLGADWETFKAKMREIRKAEVCVTCGELDQGLLGVSAPIFAPDGDILGSIGVVLVRAQIDAATERTWVETVRQAGRTVTQALAAHATPPVAQNTLTKAEAPGAA